MSKKQNGMLSIKKIRQNYGISVSDLANELGMSTGMYSSYEYGSRAYVGEKHKLFLVKKEDALNRLIAMKNR